MILKHLALTNFRSYIRLDTEIPRRILLLSGGNAQGKTTILEALFYCSTLASPLAGSDRQLIHFRAAEEDPIAVARIVADFERDGRDRRLEVRVIQENAEKAGRIRKEILVDGVKSSIQKIIGTFPAVMFLPQMTRILEGPPDERRRYLNIMLSQSVPGYALALSEFKQVMTRRNALLKTVNERGGDPDQLAYWDEMLADRAATLMPARAKALEYLQEQGEEIHSDLTDGQERLVLRYQPSFAPTLTGGSMAPADIKSGYMEVLRSMRQRDMERGSTNIGPHRDDFTIHSGPIDLCVYGSRGQIRTALLTLKLSEVRWMTEKNNSAPLLLLDETLAELDEKRSQDLLRRLEQCGQSILTTTDQTHFPADFLVANTLWQVRGGVLMKNNP